MTRSSTASALRSQPGDPAELPDVLEFMQLLWAVVHGMERRSKRMNRDLGVTGPQRLVLRVVGLFPDVSAGRLAEILHVHPSTLTGVLHRLETQRLLQRRDDPADARRALFQLTARGRLVNVARGATIEAAVAAALRAAPATERAATRRLLQRVARQLD